MKGLGPHRRGTVQGSRNKLTPGDERTLALKLQLNIKTTRKEPVKEFEGSATKAYTSRVIKYYGLEEEAKRNMKDSDRVRGRDFSPKNSHTTTF